MYLLFCLFTICLIPRLGALGRLAQYTLLPVCSVQFISSVVSDSLWPHEPQHARRPCPTPTPRVHPNPCSSRRLYHPTISSSVVPFSSCPHYLHRLCVLNQVQLFATPWPAAHQDPLSMGFSRQEYWSRLPFLTPGDLLNPGIELMSLLSPALAGRFFTNCATWEVHNYIEMVLIVIHVKSLWLNSAYGGGRARSFYITYALSGSHMQSNSLKTFIFYFFKLQNISFLSFFPNYFY